MAASPLTWPSSCLRQGRLRQFQPASPGARSPKSSGELHFPSKTTLRTSGGSASVSSQNLSAKPASGSKRSAFLVRATASALRDQALADASSGALTPESDEFVSRLIQTLASNDSESSLDPLVVELRKTSSESASHKRWPTSRDESYRFTDLRPIRNCEILPVSNGGGEVEVNMGRFTLEEANGWRLVLVNGKIDSRLSHLPENNRIEREGGVLIGPLDQLPQDKKEKFVSQKLGFSNSRSLSDSDLFSSLNGVAASEVLAIVVPESTKVSKPIHIVHLSTGSGNPSTAYLSSPRLLVVAEPNSGVEIVEEFAGVAGGHYWVNSVAEIAVAQGASVSHGLVQQGARDSFFVRRTYVEQEAGSKYSFVEAQLGSQIARHNFQMIQNGAETETEVSTFSLAGNRQLQDLHSSLVLDHPRGKTNQLHKCIVTDSSGHGVFDGNVKVNRLAQQTDAGQLSRSLLLAPRGTINVKPNLQIIADDVKCTHGAAISDLEDDQIFYFRARGIDEASARSALVFSFGAEVLGKLRFPDLRGRLEESVKAALAAEGAMDSTVAAGLGSSQG